MAWALGCLLCLVGAYSSRSSGRRRWQGPPFCVWLTDFQIIRSLTPPPLLNQELILSKINLYVSDCFSYVIHMALQYGFGQHQWIDGDSWRWSLIRHAPTLANNPFFNVHDLAKKYGSHLNVTLNIHVVKKRTLLCIHSWFGNLRFCSSNSCLIETKVGADIAMPLSSSPSPNPTYQCSVQVGLGLDSRVFLDLLSNRKER